MELRQRNLTRWHVSHHESFGCDLLALLGWRMQRDRSCATSNRDSVKSVSVQKRQRPWDSWANQVNRVSPCRSPRRIDSNKSVRNLNPPCRVYLVSSTEDKFRHSGLAGLPPLLRPKPGTACSYPLPPRPMRFARHRVGTFFDPFPPGDSPVPDRPARGFSPPLPCDWPPANDAVRHHVIPTAKRRSPRGRCEGRAQFA